METAFVQGLAEGLGVRESIVSPTYTILRVYESGRLPLYHFDVYRIADEDELYETGFDEYAASDGLCVCEWADLIPDALPVPRYDVRIERTGQNTRQNNPARGIKVKLLGMDTTGNTLSAAVSEDGRLLSEIYLDTGKKHSQTLMLAVDGVLRAAGLKPGDMDAFAVAAGPGSFTGIRIGTAACAAMAHGAGKPVIAVNTLDALVENAGTETIPYVRLWMRGGARCIRWQSAAANLLSENARCRSLRFLRNCCRRVRRRLLETRLSAFKIRFWNTGRTACSCPSSSVCSARRPYARSRQRFMGQGALLRYDELELHYLRESQAERLKKR